MQRTLIKAVTFLSLCILHSGIHAAELNLMVAGSAKQTGIIENIASRFEADNPEVKVAIKYGSSLKLYEEAKKGMTDLVIGHYPQAEKAFMDEGYGVLQARFMFNKYAILGPKQDNLQLAEKANVFEVLKELNRNAVDFYAPSRLSGTKRHLDSLFEKAGLSMDWAGYEETTLSGPSTMRSANDMGFYTYVDMGSYAVAKEKMTEIMPLFRDDALLNNFYSVTVVNETMFFRKQQKLAEAFFHFLISDEIQQFIQGYGIQHYGIELYHPFAAFDETVKSLREQEQQQAFMQQTAYHLLAAVLFGVLFYALYRFKKLREIHALAANMDELTQVGNRRLFNEETQLLLKHQQPFALLLIDLCDFKEVNDTYGHDCGDVLLKNIAKALEKSIGHQGKVFRLGGDEFVVHLYDFETMPDEMIGDLIKSVQTPINHDGAEVSVSPSIGVAMYPEDSKDASILLHMADKAMYASKQQKIYFQRYNNA